MKRILTIVSIFISILSFSQEKKFQPIYYVDYQYAGKNQLKVGNEFLLSSKDDNVLLLGVGYGMLYSHGKIHGISDFHLSYQCKSLLFARIGGSEKHLYSTAGFSLFNGLDFGFGYSYNYQKKVINLQGFTFGLTLRITNKDNVYPNLNYISFLE